MRILFIYPNVNIGPRIPLALAILNAIIKEEGHEVTVFDATFTNNEYGLDYRQMESRNVVKKTRLEEIIGPLKDIDIAEELRRTISEFHPDMIFASVIERNYLAFKRLLDLAKSFAPDIPVLVGGILPTIYPDIFIEDSSVDFICVGEGESVVRDILHYWPDMDRISNIGNIISKTGGFKRNALRPLEDMRVIPDQQWAEFDERHLLRPFEGNVYRAGSFEWSRGCRNNCSFCVGPALRKPYHASGPAYHRTKPVQKTISEIKKKVDQYGVSLVAFCDTNFLQGIPNELLSEFCTCFKRTVNLPFIIQSGAETFNENNLSMLIEGGCITASIGVESGSDKMRRMVLQKSIAKDRIKRCFDMCRASNFRLTANFMVGLPYETEADVMQSLEFLRQINPPSIAIHYFTPFLGTNLYDICVKEGFYNGFDPGASVYDSSPLIMPQLSSRRIEELVQMITNDFNSWRQEINVDMGNAVPL